MFKPGVGKHGRFTDGASRGAWPKQTLNSQLLYPVHRE